MSYLTIGDLAAEFGVSPRTLRFYGDKRLLAPRRDGQQRLYDEAQRERLRVIIDARSKHFTIEEIREILDVGGIERLPREQIAGHVQYLIDQKAAIYRALLALQALLEGASA